MCARCEELEERVAWLESELGLQTHALTLDLLRSAMNTGSTYKRKGAAALVAALYGAKGRPLDRLQLSERLPRGGRDGRDERVVDVYICAARKELGADIIATVWGGGYRLTDTGMARVSAILSTAGRPA
jgi:DNA-binding response OmpR family regulator